MSVHSLSTTCLVSFCCKTVWKLLDEMILSSSYDLSTGPCCT